MKKVKRKSSRWAVLAEMALNNPVAKVIEDHRRTGDPIAIWRDGKVVLISPDKLPVRKIIDNNQDSRKIKN